MKIILSSLLLFIGLRLHAQQPTNLATPGTKGVQTTGNSINFGDPSRTAAAPTAKNGNPKSRFIDGSKKSKMDPKRAAALKKRAQAKQKASPPSSNKQ